MLLGASTGTRVLLQSVLSHCVSGMSVLLRTRSLREVKGAEIRLQHHQICLLLVSAPPDGCRQEDRLLQVVQAGLSIVAGALSPSEEHFEWGLLCDVSSNSRWWGPGRGESCLLLVFDPHLRFT